MRKLKDLQNEARKLVKVTILWDGNTGWTLTYRGGHKVFRGSAEGFAKFLQKLKAKDTESEPKSARNMKYMDMVKSAQKNNNSCVWIWSNDLSKLQGSIFSEERSMKTVVVEEAVRLPKTDRIVTEGSIIQIMERDNIQNRQYYNVDMGQIKMSRSATPQWLKLVRSTIKKGDGKVYVVDVRGDSALIAASPSDALLGPISIPTDALY